MPTDATPAADLGPIRVSANGRYFVDARGGPFFWLGDTQWELFRAFSLEDARAILADRAAKGFSAIQVMLTGVGDGTRPNLAGETPWVEGDPAHPNERYFAGVDAVVAASRGSGMVLVVGVYHQLQVSRLTPDNARGFARWVADRYRGVPNLVWSVYPKASPEEVPVVRELAAGLREGDGGAHLITVHPDPSPASSSFLHDEPWLSFHSIQTWRDTHLIRPMVEHDRRLEPPKPVVMAEGAYEAGPEYGFEVTPLWVRRQAWWTYLAGGHHSYGHNHNWRLPPDWRVLLDAPGARHLGVLRRVLTGLDGWWDLTPDPSLLSVEGDPAMHAAARAADGRWAVAYLGEPATATLRVGQVAAGRMIEATWVSPETGTTLPAGTVVAAATRRLTTPAGWEDAVLLLRRAG